MTVGHEAGFRGWLRPGTQGGMPRSAASARQAAQNIGRKDGMWDGTLKDFSCKRAGLDGCFQLRLNRSEIQRKSSSWAFSMLHWLWTGGWLAAAIDLRRMADVFDREIRAIGCRRAGWLRHAGADLLQLWGCIPAIVEALY